MTEPLDNEHIRDDSLKEMSWAAYIGGICAFVFVVVILPTALAIWLLRSFVVEPELRQQTEQIRSICSPVGEKSSGFSKPHTKTN